MLEYAVPKMIIYCYPLKKHDEKPFNSRNMRSDIRDLKWFLHMSHPYT